MSNLKQYLPVPTLKQRYYTLEEVSQHNTANDCWVILFGEVYDLTHLVQSNIESTLVETQRRRAGPSSTQQGQISRTGSTRGRGSPAGGWRWRRE